MKNEVNDFTLLVAAAGSGTRMNRPESPKALVEFRGASLLSWSTTSFRDFASEMIIVIKSKNEEVFQRELRNLNVSNFRFAFQEDAKGTAFAVQIALQKVITEWVLVVWGDQVGASLMRPELLMNELNRTESDFILPLVRREDPYVYFSYDPEDGYLFFNETKSGAPRVREGVSDCGIFLFKKKPVINFLSNKLSHLTGELALECNFLTYFADMQRNGIRFEKLFVNNPLISFGANSLEDLRKFEEAVFGDRE